MNTLVPVEDSQLPLPKCNFCGDSGWIAGPVLDTVMFCECVAEKNYEKFSKKIPGHIRSGLKGKRLNPGYHSKFYPIAFRKPFDPICPSVYVSRKGCPIESQEKTLHCLGTNPISGYSIVGPTGTGKSFLLYALLKEAMFANRRVLFFNASELIELARKSQFSEVDELSDMPRPEGAPGYPIHLFLDEIDLIPNTEFSHRYIFDVLSYAYDFRDKIVLSVSSNSSMQGLGKVIGDAAVRRIEAVTTIVKMK